MSLMECKYISVQARTRKMNHEWESCSKDNSEEKNKETGVTLIAAVKNSACLLFPNLRDFLYVHNFQYLQQALATVFFFFKQTYFK